MLKQCVIPALFFGLSFLTISNAHGQVRIGPHGYLHIDSDSLLITGDSILTFHGDTPYTGIIRDSSLESLRQGLQRVRPDRHYLQQDDKRYYIDIIPPKQQGQQVDHTHVWLLGQK